MCAFRVKNLLSVERQVCYNIQRMDESREWYVKTDDGAVYGPAPMTRLIEWANDERRAPTASISVDREHWQPVVRVA